MNAINMKKSAGYFTVEAAMVFPIVLVCSMLIIQLLIFFYERCVWEQNACRLPVWKEYVEGYAYINPAAEETTEKEICGYILNYLNMAESEKYFLGQDMTAQIHIRGEIMKVSRTISYPLFKDVRYEDLTSCICLEPVDYIRTARLVKEKIEEKKEENDEK